MKTLQIITLSLLSIILMWAYSNCAIAQDALVNNNAITFNTGMSEMVNEGGKEILFYDFGPRFMRGFTKEKLNQARSLADFLPAEQINAIVSYDSVCVIVLDNNYNFVKVKTGKTGTFNKEQLNLLASIPYSADVLIRADFQEMNPHTGKVEDNYTTPHLTIVPEKEAEFMYGKQALIDFVKKNTKHFETKVDPALLNPGKVRFTISKTGKVKDVFLESSSGYESFDKEVMNLISKVEGNWAPASNSKGEKVEQELVFAFGIIGC